MLLSLIASLRQCWKSLVLADLLFKAIAFVLLTPLVSLLFRAFLSLSGRAVLADVEIVRFLLHPLGWLAVIIVGGAAIGILALEQSTLLAISIASLHDRPLSVRGGLLFAAGRWSGIFRITVLVAARLLIAAAPFIAFGGGLYLLLLTGHDINYYLTARPPQFWIAVLLIGALLAAMSFVLLRAIVTWSAALPLHLFERLSPGACLQASRERLHGRRALIAKWIVVWLAVNFAISWTLTFVVVALGRAVVPDVSGSLWALLVSVGLLLLLWHTVNIATSLLAAISLAALQAQIYDRFARSDRFTPPEPANSRPAWSLTWTRGRFLSVVAIAVVGAALLGATAMHTARIDDDVEITAHRGAAGQAPENTLAAVRRAIEDRADWVEIDVQESRDGVVIVAHDSDLKKVAGYDKRIWESTADELRAVDIGSFFGPEFSNERVPTLAEVLDACKGKVRLNIELKYYGHDQDLEQRVVTLVEEHDMAANVVLMSLNPDGVRKAKALRPDWRVGLLTAVAAGDLTRSDADFLAVSTKLATPDFIRRAHARDKPVFVWTVNDPVTMSMMVSRGADNLITDHPALARQVLQDRALLGPGERLLLELAFLFGVRPAEAPQ